jgi:outer membrane receptor for ferrienterochelin and colicins
MDGIAFAEEKGAGNLEEAAPIPGGKGKAAPGKVPEEKEGTDGNEAGKKEAEPREKKPKDSAKPQKSSPRKPEKKVEMGEEVVTGTRTKRLLKDVPVRTELITSKEIETMGAKNLYEVLDYVLGVRVEQQCSNCNFANVRMSGLESGYTQILIDGLPIFSGLAQVYGLQQILSENIDRIEIIRGASSSLYGPNAIGGVINIITKKPKKMKQGIKLRGLYGIWNSIDVSMAANFIEGPLAGILTLQYHHNDFVDDNGDGWTDKVFQDNIFASLKTHLHLDEERQRITLGGRYLHEFRKGGVIADIDDPLAADSEHITTDRWEGILGYKGIFDAGFTLNANLVGSYHKRLATNGARPFESRERIYLFDLKASVPVKKLIGDDEHLLTGGLMYSFEFLRERINSLKAPNKHSRNIGVYAQDEWKITKGIEVVLGLRYDTVSSSLVSDWALNPRLAVKLDILEDVTVRASVGKAFRMPYLFAEDLHLCSAAPLVAVDSDIVPESAWSFNLSVDFKIWKIELALNAFRNEIQDKIFLSDDPAAVPLGFDFIYTNGGNAYTQGVELTASTELLPGLRLKGGAGYMEARFYDEQDPGVSRSRFIPRVPEFSGNLAMNYLESTTGIQFNIAFRYVGSMYIGNEVTGEIDRTESFHIVDLKASRRFKDLNAEFFIGVDNLFNYTQKKIYTAADDAAYLYAPTVGAFFYAGINIDF